MVTNVTFEIEVETKSGSRGWRALGGRDARDRFLYFDENHRVQVTDLPSVDKAREVIKLIHEDDRKNWIKKRNFRIVQVEVVTTYTIID